MSAHVHFGDDLVFSDIRAAVVLDNGTIARTLNGQPITPGTSLFLRTPLEVAAPTGLSAGIALLGVVEAAIRIGDWNVDGRCDPNSAISLMKKFIAAATGAQP